VLIGEVQRLIFVPFDSPGMATRSKTIALDSPAMATRSKTIALDSPAMATRSLACDLNMNILTLFMYDVVP